MDCCRMIAPLVVTVVATVVVAAVVVMVLFVLDVTTDRSTAFVVTRAVGVPSSPEVALKVPVWTDIA